MSDKKAAAPEAALSEPAPTTWKTAADVPAPEPLPLDEHTGKGGSYVIGKDGKRRPAPEPK